MIAVVQRAPMSAVARTPWRDVDAPLVWVCVVAIAALGVLHYTAVFKHLAIKEAGYCQYLPTAIAGQMDTSLSLCHTHSKNNKLVCGRQGPYAPSVAVNSCETAHVVAAVAHADDVAAWPQAPCGEGYSAAT